MKEVVSVACICMIGMLILGEAFYSKPKRVRYVDCSVDIVNMAKKMNVTLLDRCKVDD